ncbi:MAG: adenine phosphoribosyltransferase [Deltaproteobacteria bacterium]|nr:adenine phosphoribosyltransferase [Deltaproteobacteria bacterium]
MIDLKKIIRDVPNFPKPGILFKDITPLLANAEAFKQVIDSFVERYKNQKLKAIVGVESRGFIFASALAYALNTGVVLIRKNGKLPAETIKQGYSLEYGKDHIEIHKDSILPGDQVLLMDDVLATGGTANASCELIQKMGGKLLEVAFVIELGFLKGRDNLKGKEIFSLLQYA